MMVDERLEGATRGEGDLGRHVVMRGQRRWRAENKMEVGAHNGRRGVTSWGARQGEEACTHSNRDYCRRATKDATAGRREGHEASEARACVESH